MNPAHIPSSDGDSHRHAGAPAAGQDASEALPLLLAEHGDKIHRLGLKLCGTPEDADDLVQEVFLLAFRKWLQFHGESSPATWLYTIAARACQRQKRLRAGQPRTLASLSQLLPSSSGPVLDLPAAGAGPLDAQLRREARDSVEKALATLPLHYRMALILKDIAELETQDVARILGIKPATVKTRVHLRQALLDDLPTRDAPPPLYHRRVCLDLLHAKQEALDRGVPFPLAQEEVCDRCRSLFNTLDLARDACLEVAAGRMPAPLRQALLDDFAQSTTRPQAAGTADA